MLNSIVPRLAGIVGTGASVADSDASATGIESDGIETRLRRARSAAGFDDSDADPLGKRVRHRRERPRRPLSHRHGRQPPGQAGPKPRERPRTLDGRRPGQPRHLGRLPAGRRRHAPSGYVAAFLPLFEQSIDRAVDGPRGGADSETVRDELKTTVRAAVVDMQLGVGEFADTESVEPIAYDTYASPPRPSANPSRRSPTRRSSSTTKTR